MSKYAHKRCTLPGRETPLELLLAITIPFDKITVIVKQIRYSSEEKQAYCLHVDMTFDLHTFLSCLYDCKCMCVCVYACNMRLHEYMHFN